MPTPCRTVSLGYFSAEPFDDSSIVATEAGLEVPPPVARASAGRCSDDCPMGARCGWATCRPHAITAEICRRAQQMAVVPPSRRTATCRPPCGPAHGMPGQRPYLLAAQRYRRRADISSRPTKHCAATPHATFDYIYHCPLGCRLAIHAFSPRRLSGQ